jgi:hypothetical protein
VAVVDPVALAMYMPNLLHNFFYRPLRFDWRR